MSKPSKITVNLKGGLGNYMFQIAACEAYALKHNKTALYNFDAAFAPHKNIKAYLDNVLRNTTYGSYDGITRLFVESGFEYNAPPFVEGGLMLDGYFQSEKYFLEFESEIRELFSETEEISKYLDDRYGALMDSKRAVSLHVRRGDYARYPSHHPMLELGYYQNAIHTISKGSSTNDLYMIFSDDINWCRSQFSGAPPDDAELIYLDNELDYIDMYLMARCQDNIIANSSFSWWGAWLNNKKDKRVIAPKKWFGPALKTHNTSDLLPNTWSTLSCK